MRFVDRRRVDVFGGNSIPAYLLLGLRTEYGVLQRINIFVDVQNLTDRRFEVWRGYRADPFMISAGASYRW
jgi:outer membrane receptor protein involved in Fe transport